MNKIVQTVFRYKLLHIIFWVWFTVETAIERKDEMGIAYAKDIHNVLALVLTQCICVYFISYYLVPRFLDTGKYRKFFLYCLLTFLGTTALFASVLGIFILTGGKASLNLFVFLGMYATDMIFNAVVLVSVITYTGRLKTAQENRVLEKQKLEAELDFLNAQINPHFLFNALNSIKVLMRTDTVKAEETLVRFASLLRYGLYETNVNQVPIALELNYLHDYIKVEKIRVGERVTVTFTTDVQSDDILIAPLLFLPFVENAFKHVSKGRDELNFIRINICASESSINFTVENSCGEGQPEKPYSNGIGVNNVRRRLNLLYKARHKLVVQREELKHTVQLDIDLHS